MSAYSSSDMERLSNPETISEQPSIYGELQLMHEYADQDRFTTVVLRDKMRHYNFLYRDPDVSERARGEIETILNNLAFELGMRRMEGDPAIQPRHKAGV